MSDVELKPLTDAQLPELRRLTSYAFAVNTPLPEQTPDLLQADWTLGAFDGSTLAACSGAFPLQARMNGKPSAVQGITAVATDPGYRRRGLLRKMMQEWMHRAHAADIPYSMLWASLGAIYQRFGYGLGSTDISYSADSRELSLHQERPVPPGHVSLIAPAAPAVGESGSESDSDSQNLGATDWQRALSVIHREFMAERNLMLRRSPPMWKRLQRKAPTHCALYRGPEGDPQGAVLYTTDWDGAPGPDTWQTLTIVDFMWLNLDAYQALWKFLLAHDLVNKVNWMHVPEDDPLPFLLMEPRRLNRGTDDGVWLRLVSVETGLARRGYETPGRAIIKLTGDELCPWNNGTWQLETDGRTTEVQASSPGQTPTVTLDPAALAVLVSGSARATDLAHSGRIQPASPAVLPQLDALFATRYRPWCPDHF